MIVFYASPEDFGADLPLFQAPWREAPAVGDVVTTAYPNAGTWEVAQRRFYTHTTGIPGGVAAPNPTISIILKPVGK